MVGIYGFRFELTKVPRKQVDKKQKIVYTVQKILKKFFDNDRGCRCRSS